MRASSTNKVVLLFAVFSLMIPGYAIPSAFATSGTLTITSDTKLTEDHNGNIVIGADNVILDCKGFSVIGTGSGNGISLSSRTGVTVKNCTVMDFNVGIRFLNSDNNTLEKNTANDNSRGIRFLNSDNNTLEKNTANGNSNNGIDIRNSDENTLEKNTVENNVRDGFLVNSVSNDNTFTKNNSNDNGGFGILDFSSGTGTAGTTNTYNKNECSGNTGSSDPSGLC